MDAFQKLRAKQRYGTESVLIVPGFAVSQIPDQFSPIDPRFHLLEKSRYVLRYDAEDNPALQQLVACTVIRNPINGKFFTYVRSGGEPRLQGKWSILIGGHVSSADSWHVDMPLHCMLRKLIEKVNTGRRWEPQPLGYVRDRTGLLSDHLGIVYEIGIEKAQLSDSTGTSSWVTLPELVNMYSAYEGWSKYLIDHYYQKDKERKNIA